MKKILSLLLVLIMLFGICGCSQSEQEEAVHTVAVKVMEAIKTNDFNLINKYSGNDAAGKKLFVVDTNDLTVFAKLKMTQAIRDKMEYEIDEIEVLNDQTATAKITVTMPKTSAIYRKHTSLLLQKKERDFYKAMEADILKTDETVSKEYAVNFQFKDKIWMMDYAFVEKVYNSMVPKMF